MSIHTISNFCVQILTCASNYQTQIPSGFWFQPTQMSQRGGIYSPSRLRDAWFPADFVRELHFPAAGLPLYIRRAALQCSDRSLLGSVASASACHEVRTQRERSAGSSLLHTPVSITRVRVCE